MFRRAFKMIRWQSLLIVLLLAFGVRWGLRHRGAPETPAPTSDTALIEEAEEASMSGPLVFDHDPVEVRPRPEDDQIETSFTFTNDSDQPVTITGLESTCSCLEASLDKRIYAPGEKGTGKALFKVSSFVGREEKTLHLLLDDPGTPEQILTFILDVPVVVSIEPNLLEWTLGEAPSAKEMTIKMLGQDPIRITGITATRENVRHELREISPGREYRLIVTPTTTADITVGAFIISMDSRIPKYARQMAYFSIVRPELAEKKQKAAAGKQSAQEAETAKP